MNHSAVGGVLCVLGARFVFLVLKRMQTTKITKSSSTKGTKISLWLYADDHIQTKDERFYKLNTR